MDIKEAKLTIESASWSAAGQGGPEPETLEIAKLTIRVHELENGFVQVIAKKMALLNDPDVLTGFYYAHRTDGGWVDWVSVTDNNKGKDL